MEDTEGISDEVLFPRGARWTDAAIAHRQDVRRQGMGAGAWADLEHLGGQEAIRRAFENANRALADGMTRNQAEALAAMAARAIDRHDAIRDRYGDDDMLDGAVLRFMRSLHGRTYGYAAIRAGGRWFLTGRKSPERLTWDQLVQWLDEAEVVVVERLSTGFGPEDDDEDEGE